MMNSLTVNIHLMLVSFFQPTPDRHMILMESPAFPSDLYAVETHLRSRGLDPAGSLMRVGPRAGEHAVRAEDIETVLNEQGPRIALVWLGGVNFFTGQVFDMPRIAAAARRHGCAVGFDLAHAVGNVPLSLHDWDVDFACWCSYKYLNAGPGAVAGCFVHEKHAAGGRLPRYAGWWGDDPAARFRMHLQRDFVPQPGAAGWQISNPPILAMAPLRASLDIFDEAGIEALRQKSILLTGYLRYLIEQGASERLEIITPAEQEAQGCQLSVLVNDQPKTRHEALLAEGVVCDFREPNVIRVAPVPLYNTFHEVWRFSRALLRCL
jgi:kynureninase